MANLRRLFFGVFLPEPEIDRIVQIADQLRRSVVEGVRWTSRAQIHVTLQFLGSIEAERVAAIEAAARRVASRHAALRVDLAGVGAFPREEAPRIVWVGARDDERLRALADDLGRELRAEGFAVDDRPFRTHVTLGRTKERRAARPLAKALLDVAEVRVGAFDVDRFALIESKPGPRGSTYEPIAWFVLENSAR